MQINQQRISYAFFVGWKSGMDDNITTVSRHHACSSISCLKLSDEFITIIRKQEHIHIKPQAWALSGSICLLLYWPLLLKGGQYYSRQIDRDEHLWDQEITFPKVIALCRPFVNILDNNWLTVPPEVCNDIKDKQRVTMIDPTKGYNLLFDKLSQLICLQ